jgi:hypothetical protein
MLIMYPFLGMSGKMSLATISTIMSICPLAGNSAYVWDQLLWDSV